MAAVKKAGILPWVLGSIVLGIACGTFFPGWLIRVFVTFNGLFSQFLNFSIPLIIIGLIVPAIADLGKGAGRWLGITAAIAYGSTLFAGFLTFGAAKLAYPKILTGGSLKALSDPSANALIGYFDVEIDAPVPVMTALVLSFVLGLGLSLVPAGVMRKGFVEFREIVSRVISLVIIPLLPLHIFGIFLNLTATGEAIGIVRVLLRVVVLVLLLEVVILGVQYGVAGALGRKNPLKALGNMLPAYFTALGTSSSAATIPVTLRQTLKNGVSEPVASFVVPLCATIHLAGSASKITAFAMAIVFANAMNVTTIQLVGFVFMLGIVMIAAPGVPGGAIMASVGVLQSMLGFDDAAVSIMIATYVALDSFGTATNVTGDGAIAIVLDRFAGKKIAQSQVNAGGFSERAQFDAESYLRGIQ